RVRGQLEPHVARVRGDLVRAPGIHDAVVRDVTASGADAEVRHVHAPDAHVAAHGVDLETSRNVVECDVSAGDPHARASADLLEPDVAGRVLDHHAVGGVHDLDVAAGGVRLHLGGGTAHPDVAADGRRHHARPDGHRDLDRRRAHPFAAVAAVAAVR